jgi:S-formylglutathione hydrolase FrmB
LIIGSSVLGAGVGLTGWGLLADWRILPGRGVLDEVLGRCDIDTPPPAEAAPGLVLRNSFYSRQRARTVTYSLAYPPKAVPGAPLPVCLVLHGLNGDDRSAFDELGYHKLLAAAVAAKVPPFVLASVSGGNGYWHPHPGDDPLGMLLTEFPTILSQHGLPVNKFGLFGWSMGGYGALLAATETPPMFPVVVANSPAFWPSYDEARSVYTDAFSSEDEWNTWGNMPNRVEKLRYVTNVRIDCGESDSFEPAIDDLRDQLPDPNVVHFVKGCHDDNFWRSVAPEQLRLIGTALTPSKKS